MNWVEIIGVHVMWKRRLIAYRAGKDEAQMGPDTIRPDDRCALGKWIYGEGKPMGALPGYEEVRALRAAYHQNAAEIVSLHQAGKTAGAEILLNGSFSRLSEKLEHRLPGLSLQVKAARDGIPRF